MNRLSKMRAECDALCSYNPRSVSIYSAHTNSTETHRRDDHHLTVSGEPHGGDDRGHQQHRHIIIRPLRRLPRFVDELIHDLPRFDRGIEVRSDPSVLLLLCPFPFFQLLDAERASILHRAESNDRHLSPDANMHELPDGPPSRREVGRREYA